MAFAYEGIDHVQLAAPAGCEEEARRFYGGRLQWEELPKPPELAKRGGVWFRCGRHEVHIGVQDGFVPARKAHPAFLVTGLEELRRALDEAGIATADDDARQEEGILRFYAQDPFGNRLEFMERVAAAPSLVKRTFEGLQKRIELGGGRLFLQDDSGEAGRYACSFQPPATAEEIQSLLDSTGLDMPGSYLELLQLTNGCSLFDHELYGGASCLIAADQAEHLYETYQEPGYLMIAVVFDDRIVMDCEKYARGEEDYMLVGTSTTPAKELTSLGSDFETWFSRFVVSNGAKFWTWRSAGAMPGYSKG